MSKALLTPHQDLGIQNIERCKGFSAQLLVSFHNIKANVINVNDFLYVS